VRHQLLEDYDIEIGAGLGGLAGKVWRIGLMGHSATEENVDTCINALTNIIS
jgi:alanine-glyoxylate transaminase/serine-glyoxylate transaminase/serine-pyruvate transaminase